MSGQIELCLVATGQQAAALLSPDEKRRLAANHPHLRGSRKAFYVMGSSSGDVMVWAGRGQQPGWVRDWIAKGGTLEQLAATPDQQGSKNRGNAE